MGIYLTDVSDQSDDEDKEPSTDFEIQVKIEMCMIEKTKSIIFMYMLVYQMFISICIYLFIY